MAARYGAHLSPMTLMGTWRPYLVRYASILVLAKSPLSGRENDEQAEFTHSHTHAAPSTQEGRVETETREVSDGRETVTTSQAASCWAAVA